jgi:hypothetical protein
VVWEAIFLLVVLKIPMVYLALVVWWAIRAEPRSNDGLEGALVPAPLESDPRPGARWLRRPKRPHGGRGRGGPIRGYRRREAFARARVAP